MAKLRIVAENYSDIGTITPIPVLALNTMASNLQSESRSRVIRTNVTGTVSLLILTDTTTGLSLTDTSTGLVLGDTGTVGPSTGIQELFVQLAPVRDISAIVLGRHNLPAGTNITIDFFTDVLGTLPHGLYPTSGAVTVNADMAGDTSIAWDAFLWDSAASGTDIMTEDFKFASNFVYWSPVLIEGILSVRIYIDVPAEQIEIGRLIVGKYIEPEVGVSLGHKLSISESGKQYRSSGSTLRSDITLPIRKLEFSLDTINESDRTLLQHGFRYVGMRKDFFISIFPENSDTSVEVDYSGIVKLIKEPSMSEFVSTYYKSKYIVEEV